ncbi:hypothetical protein Y032_0084g1712 [Ancylostoma ceylanicum]|uniref:Uncharacterized protein n=1 Tax=Ancylostoma ceylanicum TaxID=53326 RepID=A0A016TPP9_9BILA|nr:hypothetical protein Y032_0084g1712 [Ancylostoma ceylanicum]
MRLRSLGAISYELVCYSINVFHGIISTWSSGWCAEWLFEHAIMPPSSIAASVISTSPPEAGPLHHLAPSLTK